MTATQLSVQDYPTARQQRFSLFAFGDQEFDESSPEEIDSAYASWYDKEDLGDMIDSKYES
ncbi:MAG: hypothetical protein P1V19_15345 [Gimesia sp.]|nr:hypothetical protein [Gimesia sp.]